MVDAYRVPTADTNKFIVVLKLEKNIIKKKAAKCDLVLEVNESLIPAKYLKLKAALLQEMSDLLEVRPPRILALGFEKPENIQINGSPFQANLIFRDKFSLGARLLKGLEYAIEYIDIMPVIATQNRHIYNLLLKDHGINTSEEDCFIALDAEEDPGYERAVLLRDTKIPTDVLELDVGQLDCIRTALKSPISVLLGPPGTGKTYTASALAQILVNQIIKHSNIMTNKLLFCAQTNTGVTNLADRISQSGISVMKITGLNLIENEQEFRDYDLCRKLKNSVEGLLNSPLSEEDILDRLEEALNDIDDDLELLLEEEDLNERQDDQILITHFLNILETTQAIGCTLFQIPSWVLERCEFPFIVIDEASQAIEPVSLLAFNKHPQKIVIFGDDKQLPPTVISKEASAGGLGFSLFKRLNSIPFPDVSKKMLTINYRMPKVLADFSSRKFYNERLESVKRDPSKDLDWIYDVFNLQKSEIPIAVFDIESIEVGVGTSIKNEEEAQRIVLAVGELLQRGVNREDIGIIAYYAPQVKCISELLTANDVQGIEVNSIDGFQGRDKMIIIISTVRSNQEGEVGFLKNHERMNVAVTRAKEWILIFCNRKTLQRAPIWDAYLKYYGL